MALDLTPYSTAKPFFGAKETWLPPEDAERLAAYHLYESIFRNVPEAFKVIQRGSEQNPIYIPSGKTIIEAANRFLAKKWTFATDPKLGTDADRAALSLFMSNLFVREEMYNKFNTQKKWGLVRGDAIWHITADPLKQEGKRISIHTRDPGSYFPISDPVDDSKVIGCHLVDQFDKPDGGGVVTRRQTYRKDPSTKQITYEVTWWESGAWDDREGSGQTLKRADPPPDFVGIPAFALPPQITSLPVYHVPNDAMPDAIFGTSELAGLERIIGGVNQAISDEEMALAMEGIGFYATTSGPPVDDEGNETTWKIGPGWVVEIDPEADFKRVGGVSAEAVKAVLDHVGYLDKTMREASGTPDIAIGRVDAQVAESGIALALQMAPLLSKNEDREPIILGKMDQMLYDIVTMWMPAYESITTPARASSIIGDALPINREKTLAEIIQMVTSTPPIISVEYAQQLISEKLGYEFPAEMLAAIVTEQTELAKARNADPFMARVVQESEEGTQ